MAVVQLASSDDVVAVLGRDLTPDEESRVDAILDKASELFRRVSGQTFTADTSTVRVRVRDTQAFLPQRPVVSVETLTDDDGVAVTYTRFKQVVTLSTSVPQWVLVSYTHGGVVPDVVRLAVAEVAKKVLLIPASAAAGVTQHGETTGPFSSQDSYATWAQGGQTMLAPDDERLARSFRNPWRQNVILGS